MKLGVKITVFFVLVLLIVGIVGVQSYLEIRRLIEANGWVIHTHEVQEKLENVLSLLKDAETGGRGFALTGEERYLEPYNTAASEIMINIESAVSLTLDNPEQQKSLRQLRKLSREKLDILAETIKLRREGGMAAALPVILSDRGKNIMDEIRVLLNQMESRERGLLDIRNRAASETARRTMLMGGFGVLLSLMVLGIAAVFVTRTMQLADHSPTSGDSGKKWLMLTIRYAFAVAVVVLAMTVRSWLEKGFGPMPPFITFFPGVLLVASFAGGGPGVLFTILAVLAADYWYFPPIGQFTIDSPNQPLALGIFGGSSILLSILAERLQRARRAEAVSVTQEKELALLNMGNLTLLDLDHRIVRWSEGNRRLYGFDLQEIYGQRTYELLQTDFDQPPEQIQRELMDKGHWEGEATRRSKDGTQLSVAILWALRRDDHGKPLAILEVSTDMTRQKLVEESLQQQTEELAQQNEELSRQSEELTQQSEELQTQSEEVQALNVELGQREMTLQTLLDSARLPLGELEVMGKICHLATEIVGLPDTVAVICEQHDDKLVILAHSGLDGNDIPASWPLSGSFIEVVMQEDRTACLEDTSLRTDLNLLSVTGRQRFGSVCSSPLRVNGRPIGAISIYGNKTQPWTSEQFRLIEWLAAQCSNALEAMRLAAEVIRGFEELRKSEERFRLLVANVKDYAIFMLDPEGRVETWNAGAEHLKGYKAEEIIGEHFSRFYTAEDIAGNRPEAELKKAMETGQAEEEGWRVRKDGSLFWAGVTITALRDDNGMLRGFAKVTRDITKRKLAEERFMHLASFPQLNPNEIIEIDSSGKVTFCNPATLKTLESLGMGKSDVDAFLPPDMESILADWDKTSESTFHKEIIIKGRVFDETVHLVPQLNVARIYALDVTNSKKAQLERDLTVDFLRLVNECHDTRELVRAATEFFHEHTGCEAVGIRLSKEHDYPYYETRGFPAEFVLAESRLCTCDKDGQPILDSAGNPELDCMCGNVICGRFDPSKPFFTKRGNFWSNNTTGLLSTTTDKDRQAKTRNRCNGEGYESVALIGLSLGGERLGLLQLNDRRKGRFSPESLALWERLADYLAIAIAKLRTDEDLQKSEEQFRTLADSIPNLAWWANGDGYITWYNQRWYEYTGTTPEQMEGWGWQSVHDPDVLPKALERWKASIATGEPFDMELPLLGADGVFRPFLTRVTPLKDPAGLVLRWFGTNTDISAQKRTEESLLQRTAELELVNRELGSFIYSVAHDLRGPLRAIFGFSEIMMKELTDKLDEKGKRYLSRILDGTEKMSRLIDDLLNLSNISRQEVQRREVNMSAIAASVVAELREAYPDRNVEVDTNGDITAIADPGLIEVVLSNLIGNAWKFTAKTDRARIELGTVGQDGKIIYYVRDNGVGFDQKYTGKMFWPFHRLHSETEFEGTGIGLAIVDRIISRHGGKVWAEGIEGKGATIYFSLT